MTETSRRTSINTDSGERPGHEPPAEADGVGSRLEPFQDSGSDGESELIERLANFPSGEEIDELCASLQVATLREFSAEVLKGGLDHLRQRIDQAEYARLLGSWIATAEETLAAGKNVKRIAARRKSKAE